MRVAVVILNWNGAAMLRQFLPSVIANTPGADIVVADNASTDDSLKLLADEFPTVGTIVLDRNYGFAEGYNRALSKVDAEYVVLLNSDVEVSPGWLEPMVSYLDNNADVVACQPKLRSWHQKSMFEYAGAAGGFVDRYGYPYCRGRIFSSVEPDMGQYDSLCDIHWATGACLCIRLKDYIAVGGLDSRFFAHNEEIDLCLRLRNHGKRIVCIPNSVVYHVGGGTLPQGNPRKTYLNFRNNLLMLHKNLPLQQLKSVMRWRLVLDYVAMLQSLLKFNLQDVKAIYKARRDYHYMIKDYPVDQIASTSHDATSNVELLSTHSVLLEYYLKGKRKYSQL